MAEWALSLNSDRDTVRIGALHRVAGRPMDMLLTHDGTPLAAVSASPTSADSALALKLLGGGGRVLEYYFLQGGRRAWVLMEDIALEGSLRTHWADRRRHWEFVSVSAAIEAPRPARLPQPVALAGPRLRTRPAVFQIGPDDPPAVGPTAVPAGSTRDDTAPEIYARSAKP
jgi:hypothetical protein